MNLIKANSNKKLQKNNHTGLLVAQSHSASSGFEYVCGLRQFGDLTIVENVALGIGVSFLGSVRVYNSEGDLLIDKNLPKDTYYTREKARITVRDELLFMLEDAATANAKDFDRIDALETIDEMLKTAYYEKSYQSILAWAIEDMGIELTPLNP